MTDRPTTPEALLSAAYAEMRVSDAQGTEHEVNSQIPPAFAAALTRTVEREAPMVAVEVGMAFGFSSLAILAGLPEGGELISIDPFHDHYHRIGKTQVERSTRAGAHRLIEEPNFLALPRLLEQGLTIDFAYIDGMHTFDYVALDAFYLDKMLRVGGVLVFNDCGFRSIHKFLKYFGKHRHYAELDVGLARDCRGGNPLITLVRTIEGRSNQDRYFRKLDTWEPEHNEFHRF